MYTGFADASQGLSRIPATVLFTNRPMLPFLFELCTCLRCVFFVPGAFHVVISVSPFFYYLN